MIIASFLFMAMLAIFSALNMKLSEYNEESKITILQEIEDIVFEEVKLAYIVDDGYLREFTLPNIYRGMNYSIIYEDNRTLIINESGGLYVTLALTGVNGSIAKGKNILNKTDGDIYINPSP